jgi:hypothetical protein
MRRTGTLAVKAGEADSSRAVADRFVRWLLFLGFSGALEVDACELFEAFLFFGG